ncbi:LacI family DNA-binding transcriptional regulator [uncultured Pseudokineococcus sp.]|uniref:LacI family DNA-binding transcriptional regulator n=1 Tax=uncultured Pseudokineococcus sp. TaxID=1642928 RepID=UPI0026162474|nr:LacI family DNA-binding transcriptional regulator [uncultured Pseudokineococcus sp.]
MPHRATSRDVARLAGVAQSTVSYVLTGKGSISAETRARVLRAAEELGYTPDLAARSMRTRRTGRLAVVMGIPTSDPVEMLTGAASVARAGGYTMEVHGVDGSPAERTEQLLELARSGQYEGIVAFAPVHPTGELSTPEGIPVVATADFDEEMHAAGDLADASPVTALVDRLAALGHRRFLHVAGSADYASARGRERAYLAALEQRGLESLGVAGGEWTGEAGVEAVRALADDAPPLAVIAANDLIAVGVMRGAAERGWSVPGDVSVTGWDDYEVGAYLSPSLTTVAGDRRELGRRAMRRLLAALAGEAPPLDPTPLNRIVWRESTAAPVSTRDDRAPDGTSGPPRS